MRFGLKVTLLLLMFACVLGLRSECAPGSTIVEVTDCNGAPVEGARIDVKICCTSSQNTFSAISAPNGEATFPVNAKEICDGKVSFAGFSTTVFGTGSCRMPGKEGRSKCTVQVCKR